MPACLPPPPPLRKWICWQRNFTLTAKGSKLIPTPIAAELITSLHLLSPDPCAHFWHLHASILIAHHQIYLGQSEKLIFNNVIWVQSLQSSGFPKIGSKSLQAGVQLLRAAHSGGFAGCDSVVANQRTPWCFLSSSNTLPILHWKCSCTVPSGKVAAFGLTGELLAIDSDGQ